jgi:LysR family nitrogen assimilation transcriptional regulator
LDMAIIFEPEFMMPAFARQPLYRQRVYFLATRDMQGLGSALSLAQLAQIPLVMPAHPNIARVLLEQVLSSAGLTPTIVAEVDDLATVLDSVGTGLGGTIVTAGNLSGVGGADLPPPILIEPPLYVTASVVADSSNPLTRAGEALRALLGPLIKNYLQTDKMPGTEWLGDAP